jgi:hypothetical protein
MQPRIIPEITFDRLVSNASKPLPIYDAAEADFLAKYAPYSFAGHDIGDNFTSEMRFDLILKIFKNIVTFDSTVIKGSDLKNTPQEKAEKLNPIYSALDLKEADSSDPYYQMFELKRLGLDALSILHGEPSIHLRLESSAGTRFSRFAGYLREIIGEYPAFVSGSAIRTPENFSDYDTRILIPKWDWRYYRDLRHSNFSFEGKKIDFVLIPEDCKLPFFLSDLGYYMHPHEMINSETYMPVPEKEHMDSLAYASAAANLITLREALTSDGINECEGILNRIRSRTKLAGFFHDYLSMIGNVDIGRPEVLKFDSMPSRQDMINSFARANMDANMVLRSYLKL